jgi:hypothetical protein
MEYLDGELHIRMDAGGSSHSLLQGNILVFTLEKWRKQRNISVKVSGS